MKMRFLFAVIIICCCQLVHAQDERNCVSAEYAKSIRTNYPALSSLSAYIPKDTLRANFLLKEIGGDTTTIIIPVVFNVLLQDTGKVSRQQVMSQLDVLNEDFSGSNADFSETPLAFRTVSAGDTHIRFTCDTIIYRKIAKSYFIIDPDKAYDLRNESTDPVKFEKTGGIPPHLPTSRLNIWVADIRYMDRGDLQVLYGYSLRPPVPYNIDGVVVNYKSFGRNPIHPGPHEGGRTCTHEVGHYLGLRHIWGDTECGDDSIPDTPPQHQETLGCRTGTLNSCDNAKAGAMYMNFMDYCNDGCVHLFTRMQSRRMRQTFPLYRPGFIFGAKDTFFEDEQSIFLSTAIITKIDQQKDSVNFTISRNSYSPNTELLIKPANSLNWNNSYTLKDTSFTVRGLQPGVLYEIKLRSKEMAGYKFEDLPSTFFVADASKLKPEKLLRVLNPL